ncbi:hypothetical protein CL42_06975 [Acinetobacter sp. Ver3]|nr:hypothetical protein CL42_06975 [Acinetobacter sp. Ver3]
MIMNELSMLELKNMVAHQLNLPVDEIQQEDNLFMLGLDSVSLMTLVGLLREKGFQIEFQDLVEEPTLNEWSDRLKLNRD